MEKLFVCIIRIFHVRLYVNNCTIMLNSTLYDILFIPKYRILRYVLLSIVLFIFTYLETQRYSYLEELLPFALLTANMFFCNMIFSIIILKILSPLLFKRHYIFFWLLFFVLPFVIIYFQYMIIENFICKQFGIHYQQVNFVFPDLFLFFLNASIVPFIFSLCLLIFRINKYWMIENEQRLLIEASRIRIETELMKEQVSPALLCNTLHRGGVFAHTDPEETSDILMQLSKLLRYQLYDCGREKVLLDSEIHFLNRYLSILEYNECCSGHNISIAGKTMGILIPPLLFVPFLQSEIMLCRKSIIDVKICVRDNCLTFELTIESATKNTESINQELLKPNNSATRNETGIRRRLNQLYPQQHSLAVEPDRVLLTIQLW